MGDVPVMVPVVPAIEPEAVSCTVLPRHTVGVAGVTVATVGGVLTKMTVE